MTTTLQQALLKAGLINQNQLKKVEEDKKNAKRAEKFGRPLNQPPRPPKPQEGLQTRSPTKPQIKPPRPDNRPVSKPLREREPSRTSGTIEGMHQHHMRVDCEACKKTSPDVEYFEHHKASLPYRWLCVKCADYHSISDEYRTTMQSQHAQSGMFRRSYGATKPFRRR